MEDFPFLLNLNYKMNDFEIKPPSSLYHLKEIATEKYDLKLADMFYVDGDGGENDLKTEEDYSNMIQYATDAELTQVEIIIKKDKKDISEKRKESYRKKSSMKNEYEVYEKPKKGKLEKIKDEVEYDDEYEDKKNSEEDDDDDDVEMKGNDNGDKDREIGMNCEYDYFGDTRNRKGGNENYSKQGKGFKEDKRIYYIKEKKNKQREENNKYEEEEEEEVIDKSRKRAKKQIDDNDSNKDNNTSEVGPKNNRKKKKAKKDRVRF